MATKTERIELRVSPENKALIERAAALRGQSISMFVMTEALEQARRVELTTLTRRDWSEFVEILDRDEEPTAALKAAAKNHRNAR